LYLVTVVGLLFLITFLLRAACRLAGSTKMQVWDWDVLDAHLCYSQSEMDCLCLHNAANSDLGRGTVPKRRASWRPLAFKQPAKRDKTEIKLLQFTFQNMFQFYCLITMFCYPVYSCLHGLPRNMIGENCFNSLLFKQWWVEFNRMGRSKKK